MIWPWQYLKRLRKLRRANGKLRGDVTQLERSIEAHKRSKEHLEQKCGALELRVQDLECEVSWLRQTHEAGAMAIIVSKENLEGFLSALRQLNVNKGEQ